MKTFNTLDKIFLGIGALFGVVTLYELGKFFVPLYTYPRLLVLFCCLSVGYYFYKNNISLGDIQYFLKNLSSPRNTVIAESPKSQGSPARKFLNFLIINRDSIVYSSFFILFIGVIFSVIFNISLLIQILAIVFTIIYICAKILGFKLDYTLYRSHFSQGNVVRFFLIIFAIFLTISSLMLREFGYEGEEKNIVLFIASTLYISIASVLFFKISLKFPRISLYNILSLTLIFSLLGFLVYKNMPEAEAPINEEVTIVEEIVTPEEPNIIEALISDEVTLTQPRLVSQVYEINAPLGVGDTGGDVVNLQQSLKSLKYYTGAIDGEYTEDLRVSLRNTLIGECDWPQSTQGIFGPLAKQCIDNLEILVSINQ